MGSRKSTILKSELAIELNLSRGRVSQLITAGMPVRPDGRLDRLAAVAWYRDNIVPPLKDSQAVPERAARVKQALPTPAPEAPSTEDRRLRDAGFHVGAVITAHRIACHLVQSLAEVCAGETVCALFASAPLAYRVIPVAAAPALLARFCAAELAYAGELGFPQIPELDIERWFPDDVERARQLVAMALEVCSKQPRPNVEGRGAAKGVPGIFERTQKRGAAFVVNRILRSIVECFPPLCCGEVCMDGAWEIPGRYHAVYPLALLNVLVRGWLDELLEGAHQMGLPEPPAVQFDKLFGAQAEAARQDFDEFSAYLLEE